MGETINQVPTTNDKPFPKVLFRFRSLNNTYTWDELENSILRKRIYLTSALDLNDPFDIDPVYIESPLIDVNRALKASFGRKSPISRDRASEIEGRPVPAKEHKQKNRKLRDNVPRAKRYMAVAEKQIGEIRKATTVACFSESELSVPMWAHYAENHSGYCLGFDLDTKEWRSSNDFLPLAVTYAEKRPTINTLDLLRHIDRTAVSETNEINKFMNALYLCKATDWAYEREWRIIDYSRSPPGYKEVSCLKATKLIFGYKAKKCHIDRTIGEYGKRIEIFRVEPSSKKFELKLKRVKGG